MGQSHFTCILRVLIRNELKIPARPDCTSLIVPMQKGSIYLAKILTKLCMQQVILCKW